jgi:predicted DNA-binding protein
MSEEKADDKRMGRPLSLRLSAELEEDVAKAEAELGLSRSDIARLAIERGLKVLRTQLTAPVLA